MSSHFNEIIELLLACRLAWTKYFWCLDIFRERNTFVVMTHVNEILLSSCHLWTKYFCTHDTCERNTFVVMSPVNEILLSSCHMWTKYFCRHDTCERNTFVVMTPVNEILLSSWHLWTKYFCRHDTCERNTFVVKSTHLSKCAQFCCHIASLERNTCTFMGMSPRLNEILLSACRLDRMKYFSRHARHLLLTNYWLVYRHAA